MKTDIVNLAGDKFLNLKKNCSILLKFALDKIHMLDVSLN